MRSLLDLIFPDSCPSCRRDIPPSGPAVCQDCRGLCLTLPPRPSLAPPKGISVLRAAFPYADPIPRILHAFKYDLRIRPGRELGRWMAQRWELFPELGRPHALVPVPLHPRRERQRGFNQAEILADEISKKTKIPLLNLLRRKTNDAPQARRETAERRDRLREAFAVKTGFNVAGAALILIDDVTTSGETLSNCARALKDSAAADVCGFSLCKG